MNELGRFLREIENFFLRQLNQLQLPENVRQERIEERDDKILVHLDLPDLSKDHNVHLSVNRDHLVIEGKLSKEENVHANGGQRLTRSYSEYFYKTIPVPARVTAKGAKATYDKGVLKISMNKVGKFEDGTIHIDYKP
ncbi:Hsp20/alpha crystallin family protein [Tepidibacillus marianensis]|uniref:Hsp20/alpha crystallin family protein n=1 Tax=Tepidibacillus marianensis TaxID=3131995 RepID=UPI0030CA67C8